MSNYYDGTKLLSLKDLNGNKPEIYLVTTNRTGGKTTWFSRYLVNQFLKGKGKFCIIYRYNYELDDVSDKFFKDIKGLFFQEYTMTSKKRAQGVFHELFLNDKSCGYAISINNSDQIKKYSHLFSDVARMMMDEFQSETNRYCSDEVKKFISIHTSIARGQGEQVRYVPVYLIGNPVSIINPYYVELGISDRLRDNTKFLRGDGYVMEQGFNESASKSVTASGFNRAFANNEYVAYSSQAIYLNDSKAFIDKPQGKGKYLCTFKYENKLYGVREYADDGVIYCDDRADTTHYNKITVTTKDHEINYVMLKRSDFFLGILRQYFELGCFRFKDLKCKEVILKALSYK